MTEQLSELIKNEEINQLDVVELIQTYQKLVTLNVLSVDEFQTLLNKLGVNNPEPNKFVLDEDCSYELI